MFSPLARNNDPRGGGTREATGAGRRPLRRESSWRDLRVTQLSRAERRRRARAATSTPQASAEPVVSRATPGTRPPAAARRRPQPAIWWGLGGAALLVIAGIAWWALSGHTRAQAVPNAGDHLAYEGNSHVPPGTVINYRDHPPASGNHYPTPAPARVYPEGLQPGYWVHSLEHGYIVLAYRPPASPEMLQQFDEMMRNFPHSKYGFVKMIIVPYPDMPHPYAALAWTYRLWLDGFDRQKILDFYRAHVDRGPEDIP